MGAMAVYDLYSKRKKRERGEEPDVLRYDDLPEALRVQICLLLNDMLGNENASRTHGNSMVIYAAVVGALRREYGVDRLCATRSARFYDELHSFIRGERDVDRVLDAVELAYRGAAGAAGKQTWFPGSNRNWAEVIEEARVELNARFLEHAVGYQLESGEIIRADSKLLHQEAVKPALRVLSDPAFRGAEEEFLQAFEHHRHGQEKDALTWGLKALESTLKVICDARGWPSTGPAKQLIDTVFDKGLIEPMWQSEFAGLRSVLESGVQTARNKRGGHGQGAQPVTVPNYLAAFVLHQTAAAIVFLVEAHKAKP